MKILYGIQCTGNGHLSRSLKVISNIKKLGHDVDILLSGKDYNKQIVYPVKYRYEGFTLYNTSKGSIDYTKTLFSFKIIKFIKDLKIDLSSYDKIISDFEPITSWYCYLNNKECYGISNQYSLLNENVPKKGHNFIGEMIIKWLAPVSHKIGMHYHKYDSNIYMPVISDDVINRTGMDLDHYTVYLPYFDLNDTVNILSKTDKTYHIFHNANDIYRYKNCYIFPINKKNFLDSFLYCDSVITNSGFQTTSEALYLGKKMMTIPLKGQYEQECNAFALDQMGIFTSNSLKNINEFIDSNLVKVEKWEDPVDDILKTIF